jgi:hypothetical protein
MSQGSVWSSFVAGKGGSIAAASVKNCYYLLESLKWMKKVSITISGFNASQWLGGHEEHLPWIENKIPRIYRSDDKIQRGIRKIPPGHGSPE